VAAGALWIIPLVVVAFLARTIAIAALRRRAPTAVDAIDKWWVWVPFAVILCLYIVVAVVLMVAVPLFGIAIAIVGGLVLYFGFFSASSVGSPFRPRRR